MEPTRIFIIEDDPTFGQMLQYHLSRNPDYETHLFTTGQASLDNLYLKPMVITMDYSLPDTTGLELLGKIKARMPEVPVIAISSQQNMQTALEVIKAGAFDYIIKDEETHERAWIAVQNALENAELRNEVETLREEIGVKYDFNKSIKGESQAMKKVFSLMEKAGRTKINVSVTGETGTGKELVAKAIHYNSNRKNKPFVAVNMAAIPENLIESELFGHEKGAFTGANSRRIGKFEEANRGTIFLDEIGELNLNLQAKILRVLQESEVTRIGGNQATKIDARIITATHKNLTQEVSEGNFREDLYYRLIGLPVQLPPLRDRKGDVLLLAKFFLDEFSKENQFDKFGMSQEAKTKLLKYSFPGNVRELKAMIDLAAVMADGDQIEEHDITFNTPDSTSNFLLEEKTIKEYNKDIIKHFLEKYDNNVVFVADKLGIGKSTIYQMLKEGKLLAA